MRPGPQRLPGCRHQNEELTVAIDQLRLRLPGVPWLIPIRFDDCDIPALDLGGGRTLASIQRADLFGDCYGSSMPISGPSWMSWSRSCRRRETRRCPATPTTIG